MDTNSTVVPNETSTGNDGAVSFYNDDHGKHIIEKSDSLNGLNYYLVKDMHIPHMAVDPSTSSKSIAINEAIRKLRKNGLYDSNEWQYVKYAYRNIKQKHKKQFDDAKAFANETSPVIPFVLTPQLQRIPHNGNELVDMQIPGIYFCLTVTYDGHPPRTSPYGKYRYLIPLDELICVDRQRLYQLNCYNICGRQTIKSYVILAIADIGSEADRYCEGQLLSLDWNTNDFFRVTANRAENPKYQYPKNIWTEIFYMGRVNVSSRWNFQVLEDENVLEQDYLT